MSLTTLGAEFPAGPQILDAVYGELRHTARGLMRRTAWGERSLEPTGLVNEAVLRVLASDKVRGHDDHRYVFAAAVVAMRRILVERARARKRAKRGGGWNRIQLDEVIDRIEGQSIDVVELNDAIERLACSSPREAETFTMHAVLGMTAREIAEHHGCCEATVRGDLAFARAWLRRELRGDDRSEPS